MTKTSDIAGHYTKGDLFDRLQAALRDDGVDPDKPSVATLAPYDQFHGRGLEVTEEIAETLTVTPEDHLLDIGSGIGGPARYMATRFGCRVTGIDLTEEFCAVARRLTALLGLEERVDFHQGNALAMPFADAGFAGAYSMNVSMNIADKAAFYGEIHRVLKPGGWLMLSEIALGPGGGPDYPTPWAATPASSFLVTPQQTEEGLQAAGFADIRLRETREEALAFGARAKEMVERGEKPPHRAVQLVHGAEAATMAANTARAFAAAAILPIEVHCRKPA
ncbi:class I SAM-dependent methyltransferase [Pelagibius sp.]|uniref:class I SAM-dependent methyltransferase n=1 Tax=Pelagibius sp. TaxID=1931238 RepID=UPI00261C2A2F|nr:class I SAM-dependent methyltransferase [Pelagibius sp.]